MARLPEAQVNERLDARLDTQLEARPKKEEEEEEEEEKKEKKKKEKKEKEKKKKNDKSILLAWRRESQLEVHLKLFRQQL